MCVSHISSSHLKAFLQLIITPLIVVTYVGKNKRIVLLLRVVYYKLTYSILQQHILGIVQ
jgi:hypothetical protein